MLTRRHQQAIAIAVFGSALLVVGLWLWISFGSPTTAEICDQARQAKIEECASYHIGLVAIWHIGKLLDAIAPALTAIATAFIGLFTYTLYQSSEKMWRVTSTSANAARLSAEVAEQALTIGEKAWIFAGSNTYATDLDWRRTLSIPMTMRNYGHTPAIVTEYHMEFSEQEPGGDQATYTNLVDKPPFVMGMSDNFPVPFNFHRKMSDVFAFGYIRYTDAFGNETITRFCERMGFGKMAEPAGTAAWTTFEHIKKR